MSSLKAFMWVVHHYFKGYFKKCFDSKEVLIAAGLRIMSLYFSHVHPQCMKLPKNIYVIVMNFFTFPAIQLEEGNFIKQRDSRIGVFLRILQNL